jgi:hypothetical protein
VSEPKQFIMVRERVWESWARDTYSLLVLIGAMWFNANYCGGSGWIYAVTALLWFVWLLGKASKHRREMTSAEARAWLDENFPSDAS